MRIVSYLLFALFMIIGGGGMSVKGGLMPPAEFQEWVCQLLPLFMMGMAWLFFVAHQNNKKLEKIQKQLGCL